MIKGININKKFDNQEVLSNVSVQFERGITNLIIGRSGSGKTVLLKSLIGIHEVDSGEILFDGRNFTSMNLKERRELRKEIGMMFQGGALFDSSTVEENIMFPLDMFTEMTYSQKRERVDFCLDKVNLIDVNNLYPSELSGGMQKRVAIARSIVQNPKYLFCDEPNSGLDPQTAIVIDKLISEITREFNIITVVNTHDMNSVLEIGEKVMFLYDGTVSWEGSKDEILSTDNVHFNEFVFASNMAKKIKNL